MTVETRQLAIPEHCAGKRFDQALAELFPDFSRSRLKSWILDGRAQLDGKTVAPRAAVQPGQQVSLRPEAEDRQETIAQSLQLDIVYEDQDILVVNKPAGLVVHPGAGNATGTLVNGLLHYAPETAALPRAGLLHRLDKDTTGLLLVARNLPAHTQLVRDLAAREIVREYRCICIGRMTAGASINRPIGRHLSKRTRMAVVSGGRPAVTHYRVLARFPHHSFLALRLETGRTHQIRVHLAWQKNPLVGDGAYGGGVRIPAGADAVLTDALSHFRRQALHARRLAFQHPVSGEAIDLTAPLPADMHVLLQALAGGTVSPEQFEAMTWPEMT